MPGMSGLECCKKIKTSFNEDQIFMLEVRKSPNIRDQRRSITNCISKHIPYIVALSASVFDDRLLKECRDAEFDD